MNPTLVCSLLLYDDNGNARPQSKTDICKKKKELERERKEKREREKMPNLDSRELTNINLEENLNFITNLKTNAETQGQLCCPVNGPLEAAS